MGSVSDTPYTAALREFLRRMQKAEKIDNGHGFHLPGDSALYIELWALECELGEQDRTGE